MKKYAVWLVLGAVIGGVYYNALRGGFVFDDYLLVVNNPILPRIAVTPWLAFFPSTLGYRPFRTLSYVLDYRLGGGEPWIFHLSNIIYHWISAGLVFLVALRLAANTEVASHQLPVASALDFRLQTPNSELRTPNSELRTALFTAFLWALHPVQTDAVTYISGRRDVLGGLCLFLGLWAYLRFRAARSFGAGRFGWFSLSCLTYGLGILSKESVLVLPLLCWLYDVLHEGVKESLRRRWALYFLVLLGGTVVLGYFAGPMIWKVILKFSWHGGSIQGNFATVVRIWAHYLLLMVFPRTLVADYSYDAFPVSHSFLEPKVLTALGILTVVAVGAWALSRWRPLMGYGALWMLVTILPVSHVIPIKEIVAEHYLYVPVFGLCLILGVLLDAACGLSLASWALRLRAAVVYGLVALLLAGAGARTLMRNRDWIDEETLWTVTARTVPRCARAHYNLAGIYLRQKRVAEAQREFAATLAIVPTHIDALAGLGEIAFQARQYGQALGYATQAEKINPRSFRVQYLLGWVTLALGNSQEAETHFQQAAELKPRYAETYAGLEAAAKARGDVDAAARWADKRRSLSPTTRGQVDPQS
ncbi:MAG: tetratricopeptide repeat protein [Deltaproteobacteria bacterium]|nr:tetratricopeptide repeat protein [Deltaproteobacteria bacterium]